jgi:hypothetical protein
VPSVEHHHTLLGPILELDGAELAGVPAGIKAARGSDDGLLAGFWKAWLCVTKVLHSCQGELSQRVD